MTEGKKNLIIECVNLVKIYKTRDLEVLALQGLDLDVEYGELMAIIGNSGSGKSTFLNMLGGLDRPSAGKLFVDGKNLFKLTEKELVAYKRSTVGFVWQNNARNLLPYLTALQNVELPMMLEPPELRNAPGVQGANLVLDADTHTRAKQLLELVGMSHKLNSRIDRLSGGEQQRVAIALSLANRPRLLLADEPTGNLDVRTAGHILEVMRQVNRELGTTVIIVTHDRNVSKMVHRVVAIRDGKTSTEFIVKRDYVDKLADISGFGSFQEETTQNEYAVLDRAGRVQIPADLLAKLDLNGAKRVRMSYEDGKIIIAPPED
ncbi:MAG: ATP-binding cassette domain-containing protein [Oscillospiraceae bacterium]|nr:ATP-binding cassette domain-containing protein [Oscillospiraceae bacterium]